MSDESLRTAGILLGAFPIANLRWGQPAVAVDHRRTATTSTQGGTK
jgi:hypothetical protein